MSIPSEYKIGAYFDFEDLLPQRGTEKGFTVISSIWVAIEGKENDTEAHMAVNHLIEVGIKTLVEVKDPILENLMTDFKAYGRLGHRSAQIEKRLTQILYTNLETICSRFLKSVLFKESQVSTAPWTGEFGEAADRRLAAASALPSTTQQACVIPLQFQLGNNGHPRVTLLSTSTNDAKQTFRAESARAASEIYLIGAATSGWKPSSRRSRKVEDTEWEKAVDDTVRAVFGPDSFWCSIPLLKELPIEYRISLGRGGSFVYTYSAGSSELKESLQSFRGELKRSKSVLSFLNR